MAKQPLVSQQKVTALAPEFVLSPHGGEGSVPPWTEGCQALKFALLQEISGRKNTLRNGTNNKKIEFEKKVLNESFIGSAPVVCCTFFLEYMRDYILQVVKPKKLNP